MMTAVSREDEVPRGLVPWGAVQRALPPAVPAACPPGDSPEALATVPSAAAGHVASQQPPHSRPSTGGRVRNSEQWRRRRERGAERTVVMGTAVITFQTHLELSRALQMTAQHRVTPTADSRCQQADVLKGVSPPPGAEVAGKGQSQLSTRLCTWAWVAITASGQAWASSPERPFWNFPVSLFLPKCSLLKQTWSWVQGLALPLTHVGHRTCQGAFLSPSCEVGGQGQPYPRPLPPQA